MPYIAISKHFYLHEFVLFCIGSHIEPQIDTLMGLFQAQVVYKCVDVDRNDPHCSIGRIFCLEQ